MSRDSVVTRRVGQRKFSSRYKRHISLRCQVARLQKSPGEILHIRKSQFPSTIARAPIRRTGEEGGGGKEGGPGILSAYTAALLPPSRTRRANFGRVGRRDSRYQSWRKGACARTTSRENEDYRSFEGTLCEFCIRDRDHVYQRDCMRPLSLAPSSFYPVNFNK